jgi:hypothetical protein
MPSLKTTESRNSYKGIRKLSKKASKKGSKTSRKNKNSDDNITEEMRDILNSDSNNSYIGNGKNQLRKPTQSTQRSIQSDNVDPLLVSNHVPTDNHGNIIYNNNRIGALLGGISQINNVSQIGNPINPEIESEMEPQMMNQYMAPQMMNQHMMNQQLSPQMMAPQMMGQHMAPQMMGQHMASQMMDQQMAPQMMGQHMASQMASQMAPQMAPQIDNALLKNIANLGGIPRIA